MLSRDSRGNGDVAPLVTPRFLSVLIRLRVSSAVSDLEVGRLHHGGD